MTKVNNPKVKKLSGAVNNIKIGLIKVLINPIKIAAKKAVFLSAITIPLKSQSVTSKAKVFNTKLINILTANIS